MSDLLILNEEVLGFSDRSRELNGQCFTSKQSVFGEVLARIMKEHGLDIDGPIVDVDNRDPYGDRVLTFRDLALPTGASKEAVKKSPSDTLAHASPSFRWMPRGRALQRRGPTLFADCSAVIACV